MKNLTEYFRQQPRRVLYALVWLLLLGAGLKGITSLLFHAEIFAQVVRNPDHRMTTDKFDGLNSDGIRASHEASDFQESDFNIVFLGDSFIYGFLLPQESMAPPAQLESLLREKYQRTDINVANFGWTSSSPILSLRLLKDIGAKYHPDLIILALDMSDYRDEWFYKSVLEQRGFYSFVVHYPRTAYLVKRTAELLEPLIDWHTRLFGYSGQGGYFVARQPLEKSLNLFDDVYATLLATHHYIEQEFKVPFYVFVPPRHWQYTDKEAPESWENGSFDTMGSFALENFHYFENKRQSAPFPIVSLLDDFRKAQQFPLNFKVDSHWNKHGAHFFAERVAAHCEAQGAFQALEKHP